MLFSWMKPESYYERHRKQVLGIDYELILFYVVFTSCNTDYSYLQFNSFSFSSSSPSLGLSITVKTERK